MSGEYSGVREILLINLKCRKRDKRVAEHSKKLQEKAEENKKKTEEFHRKKRQERKKLFEVLIILLVNISYLHLSGVSSARRV